MERLTKYDTDGQAMMDCQKCEADWTGKHGKPMADCTALYCRNRLLDRLVKYEDMKLEPEEIDMDHEAAEQLRHLCRNCDLDRLEKLAEADRDGRVVVLPCQFGEHVFALLDGQKRVRECEVKYAVLDGWLKVFYLAPIDDPGNLYGAPFGAFGQTVFLTPRGGGESIGGDEG